MGVKGFDDPVERIQISGCLGYRPWTRYRAVAGNDARRLEPFHPAQCTLPAFEVAVADVGNAADGNHPTREQHAAVRVEHGQIARRAGPAQVKQLQSAAAGLDGRGGLDLALRQDQPSPLEFFAQHRLEIFQAMLATGFHQLRGFQMGEDRNAALVECRIAEQELLHRMGDDHQCNGLVGDARDRLQHAAAMAIRGAGIDDDHARRAHDETAVADEAVIRRGDFAGFADEGIDTLGHLLRLEGLLGKQPDRNHRDGGDTETQGSHQERAHRPYPKRGGRRRQVGRAFLF